MDVLKFNCPHCRQRLSVTPDQIDVFAPCPNCLRRVRARGCLTPVQPPPAKDRPPPPKGRPPPPKDQPLSTPQNSARTQRSTSLPGNANTLPVPLDAPRRFFKWPAASRSFSISLLIHVAIVFLAGSAV